MTQPSVQSKSAPVQRKSDAGAASMAAPSKRAQMVAGAASFDEGEARLAPEGVVQREAKPGLGGAAAAVGTGAGAGAAAAGSLETTPGADAKPAEAGAKTDGADAAPKTDAFASERAALDAAGVAALAKLPATSVSDATHTPGKVGQGTIEEGGTLPSWFMEIQNRLVASTTWGENEENAQHAIRDYAMLVARSKAGPDGKVPGQIMAFFDYIGRGTKNDAAAKKAGYKGSSALNGAKDAKNWCAGAATQAENIAKKEGRAGVLADLKARGLEPTMMPVLFFNNLAALSGSNKSKQFYNDTAYAEPLEPGDRCDFLFDSCQYGGHAVNVVADLGDSFLHVSGNTTRHSAVATGEAKRLKAKPEGLNMNIANKTTTPEDRTAATAHIAKINFGGGKLVYSITRHSSPYKALEMLETDDAEAQEAALKKLLLKRVTPVAPAEAKAPEGGTPTT